MEICYNNRFSEMRLHFYLQQGTNMRKYDLRGNINNLNNCIVNSKKSFILLSIFLISRISKWLHILKITYK